MKEIIVTGATIAEAVENGCQQLGIEVYQAEYEVLEQPKGLLSSLFGKVKVRVFQKEDLSLITEEEEETADDDFSDMDIQNENAFQDDENNLYLSDEEETDSESSDFEEKSDDSEDGESVAFDGLTEPENEDLIHPETDGAVADSEKNSSEEDYAAATDAAVAFLSEILTLMGVRDLVITAESSAERTILNINGNDDDLGVVIGHRGDTLTALQYLVSLAANNCCKGYFKVSLNVKNFREKRERTLETVASKTAYKAYKLHKNLALEPMSPYERSIIHTAVQKIEGVTSWSVGENEKRHVVIGPIGLDEGSDGMPAKYAKTGSRNSRGGYGRSGYGRGGSGYHRGGHGRGNYGGSRSAYRRGYRDDDRPSGGFRDSRSGFTRRRNTEYQPVESRPVTRTKSNYESGFTYGKIEIASDRQDENN